MKDQVTPVIMCDEVNLYVEGNTDFSYEAWCTNRYEWQVHIQGRYAKQVDCILRWNEPQIHGYPGKYLQSSS